MHKHLCLLCDALIEEGDFDCETDADHDERLCDACTETVSVDELNKEN